MTVEVLLECSEDDLIDMGLPRHIVRIMLRKAKEIADQSSTVSRPSIADDVMLLIPMDGPLDVAPVNENTSQQDDDDAPMLLISTSLNDDASDI